MIAYHQMPPDRFAALAAGLGGPDAVRLLASAQRSKRLLLLRFLATKYSSDEGSRAALDVLVRAEQRKPATVADLIGDPMVGVWAVQTVRRLNGDGDGTPVATDLAQIGALAAAAAIRTGEDAEVRTAAKSGTVTLPTIGGVVLGSAGLATVRISAGRATVNAGPTEVTIGSDDPRWQDLRRLDASHGGLRGRLAIEDGNPYRNCYHAPPADRLSAGDVRLWQETYAEAWELLTDFVPERAAELAAGLRSVVPLVTENDLVARSATAREAFGTLGLTTPRSAADLAVTLVHELQHSKLSGLLDIVPIHRANGTELHFAPWRTDKRPTGALLQGIYAFLGVADVWRRLRSAPGLEESATREFSSIRHQVASGLATLEESTELTSKGREFTTGLRTAVDLLQAG